ncbi:MAG: helicase-related protein, partial [bacterium]
MLLQEVTPSNQMRRGNSASRGKNLSTLIIESGIDIPTVNTIIINNAQQFGLAQLYQLRGRVGRSKHMAYAYLFYPTE